MTPDDVKAIIQRAKDNGANADRLDELYAQVLANCGGDEQRLAYAWSLADGLSDLRRLVQGSAQLYQVGDPETPGTG